MESRSYNPENKGNSLLSTLLEVPGVLVRLPGALIEAAVVLSVLNYERLRTKYEIRKTDNLGFESKWLDREDKERTFDQAQNINPRTGLPKYFEQ